MYTVLEYYTDYTIYHLIVLLVMKLNWFCNLPVQKLGIATQVKLPISPDILSTLRRHMDLQIPKMAALWSAFLIVFLLF